MDFQINVVHVLNILRILTMRLQLVTCPDLVTGMGIGLWEMSTLMASEVLIKTKKIYINIVLGNIQINLIIIYF